MRASSVRVAWILAAASLLGLSGGALAADSPAPAPPPPPPASAESLRVVRVVRPDTVEVQGPPAPLFHDPSRIDFDAQRKRGDVTLEAALQGRRAAAIGALPLSGAPTGSLVEPGAGVRWSPGGDRPPGEGATDRTWIAAASYGLGFFDSHTSIVDPASDGHDVLDWLSLESSLRPHPFREPDALLTGPEPIASFARAMPGQPAGSRRPRSAIYYSNGEIGELVTGARFVSPALGKGIGASFSRHEGDGVAPLSHLVSSRYAGAVGLPGAFGHSFWVDGWMFDREIEDEALQMDAFSDIQTVLGRSEARTKAISLHGKAVGTHGASVWAVRGARAKRTRIEPSGARERWEFPEWSLAWSGDWRADSLWTLTASLDAAARRVEYADVTGLGFSTRKDQGRASAGIRRAIGNGSGIAADAAFDVRADDRSFWDARASLWAEGKRASGRLDVESTHERPTWVDRLTPARSLTAVRLPDLAKTLRLTRSGDPSLEARRLSGASAEGAVAVSGGLSLSGSAAVRRVSNDFGWDLTRVESVDSLLVDVTARQRGDGWTSYGALGFSARAGMALLRALGWARRDTHLSPRAGSPPAWGVEGAFEIGITLFRGDLPLLLGMEAHAAGRREAPIEDDPGATFDAGLRADFGAAGAFVEMQNVFDRRYRSALFDFSENQGVLMPERALHFGLVWYLFD